MHWVKDWVQDPNFWFLVKALSQRVVNKDEDGVIGVTGYEGSGKSTLTILLGYAISYINQVEFNLKDNMAYLPTHENIIKQFNSLKPKQVLNIDEAVSILHKHRWMNTSQQAVEQMYATERKQNKITLLCMPRFANFSENMRNHRILFWVHIWKKGFAMVYTKDIDKDIKDPWHIDENIKYKKKRFGKRGVSTITMEERLRTEAELPNFLCHFEFPDLPNDIKTDYRRLSEAYKKLVSEQDNSSETKNFDVSERIKKISYRLGCLLYHLRTSRPKIYTNRFFADLFEEPIDTTKSYVNYIIKNYLDQLTKQKNQLELEQLHNIEPEIDIEQAQSGKKEDLVNINTIEGRDIFEDL
jgi:energy-coupling factor transporter ATP-binding protein EcfA2